MSASPTAPPALPLLADHRVAALWHVRLLGGLQLDNGRQQLSRLPSRAVGALIARLALWPDRTHAREELVELLWPGVDLAVGRNRLRQALSTLRGLIEPAGCEPVLMADRMGVRVVGGALDCDARRFESLARAGDRDEALALYRGELLPGFYDNWVHDERQRLAALHDRLSQDDAPTKRRQDARTGGPTPAAPVPLCRARLPSYLTAMFGADVQAEKLRERVLAHRLVTLLGPGGCGKTRLAVEVSRSMQRGAGVVTPDGDDFDRVLFIPLLACTDRALAVNALVDALQLAPSADEPLDAIAEALAGQDLLLVLDNFEHLVGVAQDLVVQLLAALPSLRVLVTSQRALGIDGEREFPMVPLALPELPAQGAGAAANPAIALFVDRARAVRADFHLGKRNAHAVGELVHALEGMPLAIELAASRVRSFSPADMLKALAGNGSLDLLSRRAARAEADPRHASMRRTIDWSWRLLSPRQRKLVQTLTAFEGSFGAPSVAALLGSCTATNAAFRLHELAEQSLIRALPGPDAEPRFSLYEPIRDYAAAGVTAQRARALRGRLRRWLIDWARQARHAQPSELEPELANVRAALHGAADDGAPLEALQLAMALRAYWDTDGMPVQHIADLERALHEVASQPDADSRDVRFLRSDMHELLAYVRLEAGCRSEAIAHADAALTCAGEDPSRRARALVRKAWLQLVGGAHDDGPEPMLRDALALATACGDLEAQARALHQLAVIENATRGNTEAAERMLARSQALWERVGNAPKVYARLRNRAQCWALMGRHADALASYAHCEAAAAAIGDWIGLIDASLSRGCLLAAMRRWPEAAEALAHCTSLCWQRHQAHGMAYALWNQARVLARLRQPHAAARLMACAERFWTSRIGPLPPNDPHLRRVRALVSAQLGAAQTEALWAEGRLMTLAQAVTIACDVSASR